MKEDNRDEKSPPLPVCSLCDEAVEQGSGASCCEDTDDTTSNAVTFFVTNAYVPTHPLNLKPWEPLDVSVETTTM